MANIQQPHEVAEFKGAIAKNPQRYTKNPIKVNKPLGQGPDAMPKDVKEIWFELESVALPKILTITQRQMMEALAYLFAEFRSDPYKFTAAKHGMMLRYFIHLGFTIAGREKFGTPKTQEEADSFDEFN